MQNNKNLPKVKKFEYPNNVSNNAAKNSLSEEYNKSAHDLSELFIKEFLDLCKVPHTSGYLGKFRKYLTSWVIEANKNGLNLESKIDKAGNVIIDVPASEGKNKKGVAYKDYPNVIYQAHLDMVAAAEKNYRRCGITGKAWIHQKDPVPAVYDKEKGIISTQGKCTLGADDGFGIATCLAIAKNKDICHGPLRFIFTTDEETSLYGAKNLDVKDLDAKYIINLDSTYTGAVLSSSAGGFSCVINKAYELVPSPDDASMIVLRCGGLLGGHSAIDIERDRGTTFEIARDILKEVYKRGIQCGFHKLKIGRKVNALSQTMKLCLIFHNEDIKTVKQIVDDVMKETSKRVSDGDYLDYSCDDYPAYKSPTISFENSKKIAQVLFSLPQGIIEQDGETLIQTNNVGVVDIKEGIFKCELLYRVIEESIGKAALDHFKQIGKKYNVDVFFKEAFYSLPKIKNNVLNDLVLESYEKACGIEGFTFDMHAGNECGCLHNHVPNAYIASLGLDVDKEHTPDEVLYTESIPTFMASLLYVMENIYKI